MPPHRRITLGGILRVLRCPPTPTPTLPPHSLTSSVHSTLILHGTPTMALHRISSSSSSNLHLAHTFLTNKPLQKHIAKAVLRHSTEAITIQRPNKERRLICETGRHLSSDAHVRRMHNKQVNCHPCLITQRRDLPFGIWELIPLICTPLPRLFPSPPPLRVGAVSPDRPCTMSGRATGDAISGSSPALQAYST